MNKFYIKQTKDNLYYFTLTAKNGKRIAHSNLYFTKEGCENGITTVKEIVESAVVEGLTND